MAKASEVSVSVKDTRLFKDIIEILKQVVTDKRIDESVRDYYIKAIESTMEGHGNGAS